MPEAPATIPPTQPPVAPKAPIASDPPPVPAPAKTPKAALIALSGVIAVLTVALVVVAAKVSARDTTIIQNKNHSDQVQAGAVELQAQIDAWHRVHRGQPIHHLIATRADGVLTVNDVDYGGFRTLADLVAALMAPTPPQNSMEPQLKVLNSGFSPGCPSTRDPWRPRPIQPSNTMMPMTAHW
jgi:hypothetical protein